MGIADAPVWLSGLVMAIAFGIALEAGYRLHVWAIRGREDEKTSEGAGHIISAALGLLGLLIGFTFAMAGERYEARREMVVEESNAISTTYLRDQLFDEPARAQLSALLADYVKVRQSFAAAGVDPRKLDEVDARSAALQGRIWEESGMALRTPAGAPLTTSVLQATTQMFDLAASRRAALDGRVPAHVFLVLTVYALATAGIMGYGLAIRRRRHWIASNGLFVLVALAIALIADLDQPRSGGIRVSQTPLDRAASAILQANKLQPSR